MLYHFLPTKVLRGVLACLVLAVAAPVLAQSGSSDSADSASIRWHQNPNRALAVARHSQRPILAYVTSENCGYCRKMERQSWSDADIAKQVMAGFVPLKLDAKQNRREVEALHIRAFPTTVLLSPEGKVLGGAAGFLSPEKLTKLLVAARPTEAVASRAKAIN